ncbi:hypothetical protein [Kitasatospora sp. NPDC059327]|uniref:hypothetical protein n=1 Tax=Kitasatospora sp. NPDC059327 TaxID=3346803 RepID=UPI00368F5970
MLTAFPATVCARRAAEASAARLLRAGADVSVAWEDLMTVESARVNEKSSPIAAGTVWGVPLAELVSAESETLPPFTAHDAERALFDNVKPDADVEPVAFPGAVPGKSAPEADE